MKKLLVNRQTNTACFVPCNQIAPIVLLFTEYLDPYLHNGNYSRKIILGFRSVLKLTSSYPRNPQYKLVSPQNCSVFEIISFQNINNRNLDLCWIKIDQLDVTHFIISPFTAQHVANVSTSIFRSLRLIVDLFHLLYCSGSMCSASVCIRTPHHPSRTTP